MAEPTTEVQYLAEHLNSYSIAAAIFRKQTKWIPGTCSVCSTKLPDKKKKYYCSKICAKYFMDHFNWSTISRNIRKRDNWQCQICGVNNRLRTHQSTISNRKRVRFNVHHVIPITRGGLTVPSNLITLCKACHNKTHHRL